MIDQIEVKTEPVRLEVGMKIAFDEAGCSITVGGGEMPEYTAHGRTLEEAISDLVESVTRDAIECEAREWQNDKTLATGGVAMRSDEAGKQLNSK